MSFFKNIIIKFSSFFERPKGKEIIFFTDANDWLDSKSKNLFDKSKIKQNKDLFVKQLWDKKLFLDCLLDDWEKILKETGGEVGEFLELINLTRNFFSKLDISEKSTIHDVGRLIYSVEEEMKVLNKSIFDLQKKYPETKNVSNSYLEKLSKEFAKFENLLNDFVEELKKSRVDSVAKLEAILSFFKEVHDQEEEFSGNLEMLQSRKRKILLQREEKETELLQIKDSAGYQSLSDIDPKKSLSSRIDSQEDEIFSYLVRLKKSLNHLQDFNSNFELLDTIKLVDSFQQDFDLLFDTRSYQNFLFDLQKVSDMLESGEFKEKADLSVEEKYSTIFSEISQGKFRLLLSQYEALREKQRLFPKEQLHHNVYSKLEDVNYRLTHFKKQEKILTEKITALESDLEELSQIKSQKKEQFESLALVSFGHEVQLELNSKQTEYLESSKANKLVAAQGQVA